MHELLTGKYRGAAHNNCNLNYKILKFIPIIFHNVANYDAHLFIKNLGKTTGKIIVFLIMKKKLNVDAFVNKQGKTCSIKRQIRFIDSFKFMA